MLFTTDYVSVLTLHSKYGTESRDNGYTIIGLSTDDIVPVVNQDEIVENN